MFNQRFKNWIRASVSVLKRLKYKALKLRKIKYIGRVLTKEDKKNITYLIVICVVSFFLLIGRIYLDNTEIRPDNGGTYTEGLVGEPRLINPVLITNDVDLALTRLVFSGLLKKDKNLEIKPDLAESISVSEDQKKYTVCLKQNLFWHDEEKITLDDVIFTYETVKNPIFRNPFLQRLKTTTFTKLNENCLVFNLENHSTAFLSDLTLGILPKHIWSRSAPEDFYLSEFNFKPIGSGPFKFVSLGKDVQNTIKFYTLEKNKEFYNTPPYLQEITFKFYLDFDSAVEALKTDEIQGLSYSPKEIKEKIANLKHLHHYQLNLPRYTAVFFNLRDPFINDRALRSALVHLTPKKQIFDTVFNSEGIIIHGPALPSSFAFNPEVKQYKHDPELAQTILNNAKWQKSTKGVWEKDEKVLEIALTTIDQPDFQTTAQLIQKAWQDIGIKVKLIIVPSNQIREIIVSRNFQALFYGVLEDFNGGIYPMWHSTQIDHPGINITGFNNRRVNELLEKASLTDDINMKKKYYYEFQEIVVENVPAIFLYNPTYSYLVDKKIKGIEVDRINRPEDRFIGIENWHIKTKRVGK